MPKPRQWKPPCPGLYSSGATLGKGNPTKSPRAIFSGAFNPLHAGHLRMAELAQRRLGVPIEFEISIENVDKPPLDYTEMETSRCNLRQNNLPLWFTRAPTFEEKSRLFPARYSLSAWIRCCESAKRNITETTRPRWKRPSDESPSAAAASWYSAGWPTGKFQSLTELSLPSSLRKLCDEVPASDFREDISSTDLRKQAEPN